MKWYAVMALASASAVASLAWVLTARPPALACALGCGLAGWWVIADDLRRGGG